VSIGCPEGLLHALDIQSMGFLRNSNTKLFFGGGGWLSPLGTSATNWPIVPAPDDRWWAWSSQWDENWQGKPKYLEKACSSATLSTTNPTWSDLGSNRGRRDGKPATNRLSYGTTTIRSLLRIVFEIQQRRSERSFACGGWTVAELKRRWNES
jgi:hypothetical protein